MRFAYPGYGAFPISDSRLLRRQSYRAVEADGLAVDVAVAQQVGNQVGELLRLAQARRERYRRRPRLLHLVRHAVDHRRPEDARRDGVDADTESGELARHRPGHADHRSEEDKYELQSLM